MSKPSLRQQINGFIVEEYHALVAYVRNLIDDVADRDAEDIVQDVAFHLFEKGTVGEPIEHLAAYIYSALRNRVIDIFRRKKPVQSLDARLQNGEEETRLLDILTQATEDPEILVEKNDLFRRAMSFIEKLPAREQAVILATEMDGFSFAELSEMWDIPIGTLLSRKSRSLRKLKQDLLTGI